MSKELDTRTPLFSEIKQLIDSSRQRVFTIVNAELTLLYWNIGKHIQQFILKDDRADYGKQIVLTLSRQLMSEY
jgi:hypothetical protein